MARTAKPAAPLPSAANFLNTVLQARRQVSPSLKQDEETGEAQLQTPLPSPARIGHRQALNAAEHPMKAPLQECTVSPSAGVDEVNHVPICENDLPSFPRPRQRNGTGKGASRGSTVSEQRLWTLVEIQQKKLATLQRKVRAMELEINQLKQLSREDAAWKAASHLYLRNFIDATANASSEKDPQFEESKFCRYLHKSIVDLREANDDADYLISEIHKLNL